MSPEEMEKRELPAASQAEDELEGVPQRLLERAAFALVAGEVVAIPTDTVYGLAADPERPLATEALFALKGRPASLQLPVLVSGTDEADGLASGGLPHVAKRVAERFWPGAVTIVVLRRPGLTWMLGGDGTTIGIRCPGDEFARALCARVGPLATTSANRHGEPPLSSVEEIAASFGEKVAVAVDGGRLEGPPSTVLDLTGRYPRCLREGAIAFAEIEAVTGE